MYSLRNWRVGALLVVMAAGLAMADDDPESLSACEAEAGGVFSMMCICAKSVGEKIEHKDLSPQMAKDQKFPSDKECEEAAGPMCEKACKTAQW
ncbi:MAG: hypothetical protein HYZ71_14720 [Deltaproteobacteria bacterium]|nr:hypothetical protein [Deltaproteobacteria bacterium]